MILRTLLSIVTGIFSLLILPIVVAQTNSSQVNITLTVTQELPVPGWTISAGIVVVGLVIYYYFCGRKKK